MTTFAPHCCVVPLFLTSHFTSTQPTGLLKAPYFVAFVANSWIIMPIPTIAFGGSTTEGPVNRILLLSQNGLEHSVIISLKSPLRQSFFVNKSKDRAIAMSRYSKLSRNSSQDFDWRCV